MKHWAQRQATSGGTLEPSAVNDELRAQQSSITTLDRDQLPDNCADEARVKDYALLRSYVDAQYPTGGEQDTAVYTFACKDILSLTGQMYANRPLQGAAAMP